MAGYRWPIPPADRWAIIAYVRELQRKRVASATGAAGGQAVRRHRDERRHERRDQPQAAVRARSRRRARDVRRRREDGVDAGRAARYKEPYRAPRDDRRRRRRARRDWPPRGPTRRKAQAKPYEEAAYRHVPGRRQPRRHLGGRAAAPAVCGVRARRPDLRVHHRGHRLQDRRPAIRPARVRVHEAAVGLVLAHRDLRRGPDVHAHHPVSEVHELPDERVLADLPAVRPALLLRGLLPLHLLLRLGEVPPAGAPRPRARPERRRHGDHVHRQLLADVHDVAAGVSTPAR